MLEFADDPWMSGINIYNKDELDIFEIAKEERLRDLHGPLIDQVADRESTESEAKMITGIVYNDLRADYGLDDFEAIAKAIDYSLGRWDALTRFLDDGALPIDNNWVENRIRPIALGRSSAGRNWCMSSVPLVGVMRIK